MASEAPAKPEAVRERSSSKPEGKLKPWGPSSLALEEAVMSDFASADEDDSRTPAEKRVDRSLSSLQKWDARGVDVDQKMLCERKATRGFTISMGKTTAEDVNIKALRHGTRAKTMQAPIVRRGEQELSIAAKLKLQKEQETLVSRLKRGSLTFVQATVPKEILETVWVNETNGHVHGIMTEGQAYSEDRQQEWHVISKLLPVISGGEGLPIVSCQKGCKGQTDTSPNQDNFSMTYYRNGWTLALVLDGHGADGHHVSFRCSQTVPYFLLKSEHFPDRMENALIEAFEKAQKDVVAIAVEEGWDVQASGSTAVAACWKDNKVWTANAGDSRVVIGTETKRSLVFATEDHKPETPAEKERIEASGGEVNTQTYADGWTNHRIFVKGEDFPGLCMARTLGDECVKAVGVIATPECKYLEVNPADEPFLVIASDGIWEFLESDFIVKACAKKFKSDGLEKTSKKLHHEARKRWKQEEGDYCDDITSIVFRIGW